jgi:simple sugar transport system permease protein
VSERAALARLPAANWPRRLLSSNLGRLALITVLVFAAMGAAQPELFFTRANFSSMAFQFPEFALLALAVMVSMLTGGIDLSVIGLANLSSMLAVLVMRSLAPDPHAADTAPAIIVGIAALLATGAIGGLLNGIAIAAVGIPPILATLGTGLIFTGIAVVLSGGAAVLGFPDAISVLGNGSLLGVPVPVLVFVALAAAVAFILNWTRFGLRVYLLGSNAVAARFAGIDNFSVTLRAYLISGVLAAAAGLIIAVRANSAKADYGTSYLLLSILIAVLGGINPYGGFGKVSGLVLAVLLLQFLSSGLNMLQVSNFAVEITWGALLLLVMVINTGGLRRLLGRRLAGTSRGGNREKADQPPPGLRLGNAGRVGKSSS